MDIIYGASASKTKETLYKEGEKKLNKRNIASILYSDGLSEKIMDCSKFVTPKENLISREELAKRARYRYHKHL